ncbi:MAG: NADH-quinone oxidoreductase subunit J [Gammaproteobacteria bacterium]|jgi:NADH-quinone oxidoreductase subunit J
MLWNGFFFLTSAIMLISALAALFARQPMHGGLYLVTSMVAMAVLYYLLGGPFISALQVSLYVGAVVVLLVFMMTMLHRPTPRRYVPRLNRRFWWPMLLLLILLAEMIALFATGAQTRLTTIVSIGPQEVAQDLFGHYLLLVEATALLLLAALTAVLYLSRKVEEPV